MLTYKQVINKPVITSDGRILGKVASAIVDEAWRIPLLSVSLERNVAEAYGVKRPLLGTPRAFIVPEEVSALSDNVILKRRFQEMKNRLQQSDSGLEVSKLLGRKVLGEGGYYFGDLEDMTIDQARWRVSELVVEVRKKAADDAGFPMTIFGTCKARIPVKRVDSVKDHILLSVGLEDLKDYIVKERSRE